MSGQSTASSVEASQGFDYALIDPRLAQVLRGSAERIRQMMKRTIDSVVKTGLELREIKRTLPHRTFCGWLTAEFGWTRRSASRFMLVAGWLGGHGDMMSQLRMDPTAAYILTAPSVPNSARQEALERAENGEAITAKIAREIIEEAMKNARGRKVSTRQLQSRLARVLQRYVQQWPEDEEREIAEQVHGLLGVLKQRGHRKK